MPTSSVADSQANLSHITRRKAQKKMVNYSSQCPCCTTIHCLLSPRINKSLALGKSSCLLPLLMKYKPCILLTGPHVWEGNLIRPWHLHAVFIRRTKEPRKPIVSSNDFPIRRKPLGWISSIEKQSTSLSSNLPSAGFQCGIYFSISLGIGEES